MRIRNVSLIIFYDDNKKILLQNREGISKIGEDWAFFGGGIEEGETPEDALKRETYEELRFNLKNYKHIGKYENTIGNEWQVIRHVFISPLEDNLSRFKQCEGKKMQLFTLKEAKKLRMVPGDEQVIAALENIL